MKKLLLYAIAGGIVLPLGDLARNIGKFVWRAAREEAIRLDMPWPAYDSLG